MHALEKEMATHPSVLAWRIPGTREPGGLLSIGSHRVGYNWTDLAAAAANYRVLVCWTCQFQSSSLFFVVLASSVCKSLRCLVSALTPGCEGGHLFRLTCSVVLWGGRNTANITGMCAECSQCLGHTRFAPTHSMYAFPVYTAQAPGCSARELS